MGTITLRSFQDWIAQYEKDNSLVGWVIQKGEVKTTRNIVWTPQFRNKMTEQHENTELELKQKVDEKRKELEEKEAEISNFL